MNLIINISIMLAVLHIANLTYAFTISDGSLKSSTVTPNAATQRSTSKATSHPNLRVLNIVIKSIDNNSIHSLDGKSFPINSSTKIINNHNPDVKLQTGELLFQDGNLVTIIIK